MSKKIVVLGAGYAGVLVAKKLAKRLKKEDVEITLVDRHSFHTMLTELHEVAAWRVEEDSIRIDLQRVFAGRRVRLVQDTIVSVDYAARQVACEKETLSYDYLVIATGSKPAYFNVEGAAEHSFSLWSYEDAVRLREHIMEMFRRASSENDPERRKQWLTFCVVGAGFTGVEMAGELAELVPILCKRFGIDRSLVTIYNADALNRVVPVLPESQSRKVQRRLEKMGVTLLLGTGVCAVGPDFFEYKRDDVCIRIPTHTTIWTAGIQGTEIASDRENLTVVGRGRVQTDAFLRAQGHTNVYVAGDNMYYVPEGQSQPVPQMVENCEASAEAIAHNLVCELTGQGEMRTYQPKFHGVMCSVGGRYGVAYVGTDKKKIALASFFAMFCKHFINLVYFVQVLGWNKIFSYLRHEFFTIRNCRSFVGGHFSNRTPSFLLVPLRVFLGFYWVYEGWVKVKEGWLTTPKLTGFFNGANAYYEGLLGGGDAVSAATGAADAVSAATGAAATAADAVSAATGAAATAADAVSAATGAAAAAADAVSAATGVAAAAADAVSAATGAAAAAADAVSAASEVASAASNGVLINWDILGFLQVLLVNAGEVALKLRVSFVDWIINGFVLPSDTVQMAFQITIVLAEILVGLALMGGLFTFLAAGVSLMLQVMFLTSTGLYMNTWWMAFAAIAVLIGGGRTFGLDYWVMPALKDAWKRVGFVKKWYLYND